MALNLRRIGLRLGAVLAGTIVGLLLGEVACRLASPEPGDEIFYGGLAAQPQGLYDWSRELGKEPVPGARVRFDTLAFENEVRINSLGMRGPEPTDGPKWLTVGDSFTMGVQVPEEDTFQALLSQQLGVQVLNGGCDDYSTVQAARRYTKLTTNLDVDRVILVFFLGNDLVDNVDVERRLQGPRPRPMPVLPGDSLWGRVQGYSMLAAWANVAYARMMTSRTSHAGEGLANMLQMWSSVGGPYLRGALPRTTAALDDLERRVEARGDPLTVVVVPPGWAVDPPALTTLLTQFGIGGEANDAPHAAVIRALEERDIDTCDLWDTFRAAAMRGDHAYLRFDGHWNRRGHELAAEAIAACLAKAR